MPTTIWQQCYDKTWTLKIPLDGSKSYPLHACVSVIEDGSAFYLALQVNGTTKQFNLANACVSLPIYIFDLKVCIANLNIAAKLISFDISVDACIGVTVGPVKLDECVQLLKPTHIQIGKLETEDEKRLMIEPHEITSEPVYAYFERASSAEGREALYALPSP